MRPSIARTNRALIAKGISVEQESRESSLLTESFLYLVHGNRRGFSIYGCRCDDCREAMRQCAAPNKIQRAAGVVGRKGLETPLGQYLSDIRFYGESRVKTAYNRKCVKCHKQCVPLNTYDTHKFAVDVTRCRVHEQVCLLCQKNKKPLSHIVQGTPCRDCERPMNRAHTDVGYVVTHKAQGLCATCYTRDHRRKDRKFIATVK